MRLLAAVLLMAPIPYEPPPEPGPDGWLGVYVDTSGPEGSPVTISSVVEDGPADKAGIRPRDVIVQLGLFQARSGNDVIKLIRGHRPGQTVVLAVRRDGQTH